MATIARYEFMGSWIFFWFFMPDGCGNPLAILYLVNGTIRTEEQVDNIEQMLSGLRARR
jgi:hypothetical protein